MFCVRYVITVMEYIDILFLGLGKGREEDGERQIASGLVFMFNWAGV